MPSPRCATCLSRSPRARSWHSSASTAPQDPARHALAGLYTPGAGRIRWDGADWGGVDPEALRRSVAVIVQDFLPYHLPARDNIALGRYEAIGDLPAIRRAAYHSDADRFIEELMALGGLYAELFTLQARADLEPAAPEER